MNNKLILLVDDNKKVQMFNRRMLERSGFSVELVMTLEGAREFLAHRTPDAIILDIGMPDGSGLDFLRELRETSQIPVLLLTGYNETKNIVKGFKTGCNDYLTKPYTFEVLQVRLRHLLQNVERVPEVITRKQLTIKLLSQKAFVCGEDLLLTPRDFALLLFFVQNEECLLDAETIYEKVWGQPMAGDSRALGNAVSRLRKKLRGCGYTISALYGSGYRFEPEER